MLVLMVAVGAHPAYGALTVGKTYNNTNYLEIQDLLVPSLLNWVKKGEFILETGKIEFEWRLSDAILQATLKNEDKYEIDKNGMLSEKKIGKTPEFYYGYPFPTIDPKDPKAGEKIMENREPLLAAMDEAIRTQNRDEWLQLFEGADIPAAPIHNITEAAAHPQAVANEYVAEVDHPKEGRMKILGIPFKLHKTPGRLGIAPELGQHTDEVLAEIARYSAKEIAQMREQEII